MTWRHLQKCLPLVIAPVLLGVGCTKHVTLAAKGYETAQGEPLKGGVHPTHQMISGLLRMAR